MEATLIYPHQLFARHPAVGGGRAIFLLEEPLVFGNDTEWPCSMHQQKLVLHRASMRAYQRELEARGHQVTMVENTAEPTDSAVFLDQVLPANTTTLHLADPEDNILMRRIRRLATARGLEVVVHDSPNFLTPGDFLDEHIGRRKRPFMANFYKAQRQRTGILIDTNGGPLGGQWSFDADNRKRLPKGYLPPPEPMVAPNGDVRDAVAWVRQRFPENPGNATSFRWPVTRADAVCWLDRFFAERFAGFGAYEDAISTRHATLHHAAITPMLNIGLLDPQDLVDRALAMADSVPINSLEGFIRQIIGWREFMRGIYRHRGVAIRTSNYWNFERRMPTAFYHGNTGIPPVDRVIRQVLDDGWCHHIERLMVLGNFMLLCRIHPNDVYRWFMELFVDATDWVMVPNVYGMSQFADGGTFTTKPYISGSNYVLKMSDEKKGPWGAVWDSLFWTFIGDHPEFFLNHPRLSMMARQWAAMPAAKQSAHRQAADAFLTSL